VDAGAEAIATRSWSVAEDRLHRGRSGLDRLRERYGDGDDQVLKNIDRLLDLGVCGMIIVQ
jgi:hypothetical protein